ncbi:MAG: glycosyltransferase [Methylobacter sp.]|nr:glycosyltransferase [Methylobacter sp.]
MSEELIGGFDACGSKCSGYKKIPTVSVIIPTHNRPEFLSRALRSVLAQTQLPHEIIVINDAGIAVDNVIAQYNESGIIRYVVHEINRGIAVARNTGLKLAQGDYIALLDDDDMYLPKHLEILVAALKESYCRFAYSFAEYVIEDVRDGELVCVGRHQPYSDIQFSRDDLLVDNFIPTPTWVFCRSLVSETGVFDEFFGALEDWEWLIRAAQKTDFLTVPCVTLEVSQRLNDTQHILAEQRSKLLMWMKAVYDKHPVTSPQIQLARHERVTFGGAKHLNKEQDLALKATFKAAKAGSLDLITLINITETLNAWNLRNRTVLLYQQWIEHIGSSPYLHAVWFNLAVTLHNLGQNSEAEDAYRQSLIASPSFNMARLQLADLLELGGSHNEALENWRLIVEEDKDSPEGQQALAHMARFYSAGIELASNALQNQSNLQNSPIRVAIWSFYEELSTDGFLFKNSASIGYDLLKPWHDLYVFGQTHGIDFVTYDQVKGICEIDAVIFLDRPQSNNPKVEELMGADIAKYLIIYECEVIKQDTWESDYHQNFNRIFTWSDTLVDGQRYIKINFAIDTVSPYDFEILKSEFNQRKLVTLIAGAKHSQHPNELYSHRNRTIRWFESNAIDDFDLYGVGWNSEMFPSYKGKVDDKLATLSRYRFAICYENAMQYPGYISEKILDCFRAGVVPVYGGAPNIGHWIPANCYIDICQFTNYDDLYVHLKAIDIDTHGRYLDNIERYLSSSKSYPFSTECFINTVTSFVTWDVQLRRNKVPEIARKVIGGPKIGQYLKQEIDTLVIRVENADESDQEPLTSRLLERVAETENSDLVVYIGYGYQLPVYKRARALWQFYISHFPRIEIIFVRETEQLPCGEVVFDGYDLLVGIGNQFESDAPDYASTGFWSQAENSKMIFRQMAVYEYLLGTHNKPFFLYQTTITSVIDFRTLLIILDHMPVTGCYAGTIAPMADGLTFTSGANSLFSSDILELMLKRYDSSHIHATLPNDVWQAHILEDIPRLALPSFNFLKPKQPKSDDIWVSVLAQRMLKQGHFHFRVKTTSLEEGIGKREDVDPWIMLKIMEEILFTEPVPAATRALLGKYSRFIDGGTGSPLSAYSNVKFYSGPRDFLLFDAEAGIAYPELIVMVN